MPSFTFAKEQPISKRQYERIQNQIARFASLFTKRTSAVKLALRKAHEFGWARRIKEIPVHRYRNALMAVSMMRSDASFATMKIRPSDRYAGLGLIPYERKRATVDPNDESPPYPDLASALEEMLFGVKKKPQHLKLVWSRD